MTMGRQRDRQQPKQQQHHQPCQTECPEPPRMRLDNDRSQDINGNARPGEAKLHNSDQRLGQTRLRVDQRQSLRQQRPTVPQNHQKQKRRKELVEFLAHVVPQNNHEKCQCQRQHDRIDEQRECVQPGHSPERPRLFSAG